jgi:lactoylglutathione lyase
MTSLSRSTTPSHRPPREEHPIPATKTHITGVRTVSIPVEDQEAAARAELQAVGVDTDEIQRWPGVPAMFAFRDPDGNAFSVTDTA